MFLLILLPVPTDSIPPPPSVSPIFHLVCVCVFVLQEYYESLCLWLHAVLQAICSLCHFFTLRFMLSRPTSMINNSDKTTVCWKGFISQQILFHPCVIYVKGRVGKFEKPARVRKNLKTHSRNKSATSLQSPSSNTHERAHDQ